MSFLGEYGSVILFYVIVIAVIYFNRKKFDFQAKFIAMYRTKLGIKLMHLIGRKATRTVKFLGIVGVVVGFIGLIFGVYTIIDGLYKLFFVPTAPATFAPVIPGVKIPGVEIFVPFWYGIIALFIVVVIHEFAHGVVSAAYKIKVKHSGFVMFGPLPGAFVEPDEKKLFKAPAKAQLSVYAAGPFSNVLLAAVIILFFGMLPLFAGALGMQSDGLDSFSDTISIINYAEVLPELHQATGLYVGRVEPDSPAELASVPADAVITFIDDISILENETAFVAEFFNLTPDREIVLGNENETWTITTGVHPEDEERGFLGVSELEFLEEPHPEALEKYGKAGHTLLGVLFQQLFWIILLSLGIGLANLLPLGPVDGGRMYLVALEKFFSKKKAKMIWGKTAVIVLTAIILLVFVPILKAIFV